MATTINITRKGGVVTFETVSIPTFELVIWANQDPQAAHWPELLPLPILQILSLNQIGPYPSPNSSAVALTNPGTPPTNPPNLAFQLTYTCKIHPNERGVINVFNPFQAAGTTTLPSVTKGTTINQPVATGGMSPYNITEQAYQVTTPQGTVIQSGSGSSGPGLALTPSPSNAGINVTGAPSVSGTYTFAFNATDGMGLNVQQSQFTMVVT